MKIILYIINQKCLLIYSVFLLCLISCDKENSISPKPIANFGYKTFGSEIDTSQVFNIPTNVNIFTSNSSINGSTYHWDLGDGRTETRKEPVFSYPKSGIYDITLTVKNRESSDLKSKTIKVVDRSLISVQIKNLNWNTSFNKLLNWSSDKKANVFVRIYLGEENNMPPELVDDKYQTQIYYQSPTISNVNPNDTPIDISVQGDYILESPDSPTHNNFIYCLYAEEDGEDYLLFSNWGSGTSISFQDKLLEKTSEMSVGFNGAEIVLYASF